LAEVDIITLEADFITLEAEVDIITLGVDIIALEAEVVR
jgi:hypothetical protein